MKYLIHCFILLASIHCATSPMITLDGKRTADFGTFPANKKQRATFIIKNTGDEDLKSPKSARPAVVPPQYSAKK